MKKLDPYSLRDIFQEIELKLIKSMRSNLARHEAWEQDLGFQWEQWQLAKLRSLGQFRASNRKLIASYLPEIQDTIDHMLKQTYGEAYNRSIALSEEIGLEISGFDSATNLGDLEIPEDSFFKVNEPKLNAIINEMQTDFNRTEGLILRRVEDSYRQIIAKSVIELGSGSTSINKAVDDATKEFLSKGIDCIVYKDGKRVNIASYAEMYLRTASQRARMVAEGQARDRMKTYTILSSQHANCCEHCLAWQSRVMIDDVYTSLDKSTARTMSAETGYALLSEAMDDSFLHPNCRHTLTTFFPGKSTEPVPFTKEQEADALRRYNLEQEQRKLENVLRKWKRIKEGTLDADNMMDANRMVKFYQKQIREHVAANPNLRREYWRERVI